MTATFVYDDQCGFCSWWASFFARRTQMGIVGFSELTDDERERLPEDYEECAHLLTDEAEFSCGAAIEEGLVRAGALPDDVPKFFRQFTDYPTYRERLYREAAERRDAWGFFVSEEPPARREPEA